MRLGIGSALRAAMMVLAIGLVWNGSYGCASGDKESKSDEVGSGDDDGSGSGSKEKKKSKKKGKKKKKAADDSK